MKGIAALILFSAASVLGAYEITLLGGGRMDIPEAWVLDDSDPAVPSWYSPDRRSAADVVLWESGTWRDIDSLIETVRPEGAEGDVIGFPCWNGMVALADWTFSASGGMVRGWFLFSTGAGADVKVSAIAAAGDFIEQQPFLLSVLDSYVPSAEWALSPGAVGTFLELSGEQSRVSIRVPFNGRTLEWAGLPAADQASQDVIEREALVLSAYSNTPELFYPAWERYYRLIFRDSYSRLTPMWKAISEGVLSLGSRPEREFAETLLAWLQSFEFGSTEGFSDLLAPSKACSSLSGDCDSLSLVLLIIMDRYKVDGRLVLSQQARHAVAALDLPGDGLRYSEAGKTWILAELTSRLPLGVLPDRLSGVTDWFGVSLRNDF
jgi:hypothetical protein